MTKSSVAWALGGTVAVLGVVFIGACTSGKVAADDTSSVDDSGSGDSRQGRPSTTADPDSPPHSNVPEGWERYTDYDPACGIYVPTDTKYLPEPIRWEPCGLTEEGLPGPDSLGCQKIAVDRTGVERDSLARNKRAELIDGRVQLLIGRSVGGRYYQEVVELDGPVLQALLLTGGCGLGGFGMGGGNVMYRLYDTDRTNSHWPGGAIGGSVGSLRPRAYFPKGHLPSKVFSHEYAVGSNYFIESSGSGADPVYSMTSGQLIGRITRSSEDAGMMYAAYQFRGDDVFWVGDNGQRTAVNVWTLSQGVKTLVGWPGDISRIAGGIGVDGVDMAWVEASGRTGNSFEHWEIWTAKYTTDPDVVARTKRRLFANRYNSTLEPFVVGCGYAAVAIHPQRDWGQSGGFLLVRLSDGMSWTVETKSLAQRRYFEFGQPLAITCDEVIVNASSSMGRDPEVARIRIESLGPGTPIH